MTTMPPELSFGYVTGRFILAVADAGDADRTPDAVPASGMTVKITPKQQIVRIGGAAPVLVAKQPITCTVDGSGVMTYLRSGAFHGLNDTDPPLIRHTYSR